MRKHVIQHGKWLAILTIVVLTWIGFDILEKKKENYTELHRKVSELEWRIKKFGNLLKELQ